MRLKVKRLLLQEETRKNKLLRATGASEVDEGINASQGFKESARQEHGESAAREEQGVYDEFDETQEGHEDESLDGDAALDAAEKSITFAVI